MLKKTFTDTNKYGKS